MPGILRQQNDLGRKATALEQEQHGGSANGRHPANCQGYRDGGGSTAAASSHADFTADLPITKQHLGDRCCFVKPSNGATRVSRS